MPDPQTETNANKPTIVLRTYRPSDFKYVDHLWYSTYFSLVPEGVRRKLSSPFTWAIWCAMYAYLLMIVPILLSGMGFADWVSTALKLFFTIAWALVGFAGLFVLTDQLDTVNRVEVARHNDLSKPEDYYLPEKDGSGEERANNSLKSHFWVLLLDNKICGMIGLAVYDKDIKDKSPVVPPVYQQIGAIVCRRYGFSVPSMFKAKPEGNGKGRLFAKAHEPNSATLQRLAVEYEYQGCSLSTTLIDRALSWANDKGIKRVYATTNEMQTTAAAILSKRHGFKRVNTVRTGWFGQSETSWECDVKEWIKKRETEEGGS